MFLSFSLKRTICQVHPPRVSSAVLLAGFVLIKDLHISQNTEQKYGISPSNKEHLVKFLHATQLVTSHKFADTENFENKENLD